MLYKLFNLIYKKAEKQSLHPFCLKNEMKQRRNVKMTLHN